MKNMINIESFIIVTCILIFQAGFVNKLEKKVFDSLLHKTVSKRPLESCNNIINEINPDCYGMPSGHAEASIILAFYIAKKYSKVDKRLIVLMVLLVCLQRIITKMHTPSQVIVGLIFGSFYGAFYSKHL